MVEQGFDEGEGVMVNVLWDGVVIVFVVGVLMGGL